MVRSSLLVSASLGHLCSKCLNCSIDIKGSISPNISDLKNLQKLRLSYNKFTGALPSEFKLLQNLHIVQLQANRLTGELVLASHLMLDSSSFISDCGVPTDFEDPLLCSNCTVS